MVGEKKSKQVKFSKKLAGTNWGIGFNTLRNSAVALVHSTAEHAAPGWSHSWHVKVIDTVLNDTLRLISGTMPPTLLPMSPITASILPAATRRETTSFSSLRKSRTARRAALYQSISDNDSSPLATNAPNAVYGACK